MTRVPRPPGCAEPLPPTRSPPGGAGEWDRETHEMAPCSGRKAERYSVTEFYAAPGLGAGRSSEVVKRATGEARSAFLAHDWAHTSCDGEGMSWEGTARAVRRHGTASESLGCEHLDGVAAVVDCGWPPDPRANPEADVGPWSPSTSRTRRTPSRPASAA